MPTTSEGLTYPDSSGHTRLWEHLQTLAVNVNTALRGRARVATANEGKRVAWKILSESGSIDANSKFVFTHGLGFTPSVVIAMSASPSARFAAVWGVDAITSTTLTVRFLHPTSTGPSTGTPPAVFIFAAE